uniref:Uncharacterized protein n=1 Tax=Romanomermis culicivorax TaxID=13658 RepID=A0A915HWB3_ROMCU
MRRMIGVQFPGRKLRGTLKNRRHTCVRKSSNHLKSIYRKTALSYFAAWYHVVRRGAGCPVHTNRRRRAVPGGGLSYFAVQWYPQRRLVPPGAGRYHVAQASTAWRQLIPRRAGRYRAVPCGEV